MARKKLQKLFALLLTLSMTMSLLGVTAFAEDEDDVYLLEVGQTIDCEGFLYWYEGVNPHITSVTVAE